MSYDILPPLASGPSTTAAALRASVARGAYRRCPAAVARVVTAVARVVAGAGHESTAVAALIHALLQRARRAKRCPRETGSPLALSRIRGLMTLVLAHPETGP